MRDESGTIESRSVFRGRVLDLNVERVRYPDGSEGELEIVRHRGAAAALPVFRAGEWPRGPGPAVVLIRQHRHAAGGRLWELPAGKLDEGETAESCAARELEEETGIRAAEFVPLTTIWTTPGFTDERIHLFLAMGLEEGEESLEAHEFIERHEMTLREALERVDSGEIDDAKTMIALLLADRLIGESDRGGRGNGPGRSSVLDTGTGSSSS
ncbi:MAG: NUDIX hydrolase [marine benthic group bacterium]|nr:NUDIX hydrolase [Gemmatimonadota bacterium]